MLVTMVVAFAPLTVADCDCPGLRGEALTSGSEQARTNRIERQTPNNMPAMWPKVKPIKCIPYNGAAAPLGTGRRQARTCRTIARIKPADAIGQATVCASGGGTRLRDRKRPTVPKTWVPQAVPICSSHGASRTCCRTANVQRMQGGLRRTRSRPMRTITRHRCGNS